MASRITEQTQEDLSACERTAPDGETALHLVMTATCNDMTGADRVNDRKVARQARSVYSTHTLKKHMSQSLPLGLERGQDLGQGVDLRLLDFLVRMRLDWRTRTI